LKRRAIFALLLLAAIALMTGCGGKPVLVNLTPQELFETGKTEFQKKHYLKAIEYFQAIVYNYPGESIVDTAQYYLALSYFENDDYELAQVEFNRLVLNYPSSIYFQHALFMKAASYYEGTPGHYGLDQTKLETAIKQFEDFIIDYPEAELLPQAKQYLLAARTRMAKKYYNSAVVYNRMSAFEAARIYYQKVVDDYTDTEFGPLATYYVAEMDFKRRRYDNARTGFEGFLAVFPDHELAEKARERAAEAAYKSGEQAFGNGDAEVARERLENFVKDYPDHNKVGDAEELLRKLHDLPSSNDKGDDANS